MKLRSLLARLVLATSATAGVATAVADAPAHAVTTGDASALVTVNEYGWPAVTGYYAYNSTGAGIGGGPVAVGRVYLDINGNNGPIGTPQLTMWHQDGAANDPLCTIVSVGVVGAATRITVQCFDASGIPANTGQFFLTYSNQPRPDRLAVSGPSLVRLTTDFSATKQHNPAQQYRSSGAGSIVVYRQNVGTYQVRIPGGALAAPAGVAFASAVGTNPRWCNPQGWYPVGADMYVDVRCYASAGTLFDSGSLADSRFTLTISRSNVFGNPGLNGGSQWAPWTAASSTTTAWYGWNSTGGSATVRPGSHVGDPAAETYVQFNGPTGVGTPSLMVSGYGPHRCNLHRDGTGSGYTWLVARCIDALGTVVSQALTASKINF